MKAINNYFVLLGYTVARSSVLWMHWCPPTLRVRYIPSMVTANSARRWTD